MRSLHAKTAVQVLLIVAMVLGTPRRLILTDSNAATAIPSFEMETEGVYTMRAGDSESVARTLALFDAKHKAVEAAYKYFSRKELTGFYGKETDEILDLAADNLQCRLLREAGTRAKEGVTHTVKIHATLRPTDFIEAEMENRRLEQSQAEESFRETMEPTISPKALPGHDLATAHRLFRIRSPRAGIIYLDRLQQQFPNWSEIFEAKALGYYLLHEPSKMSEAIETACRLGSQKACDELKMLRKVDDVDPRNLP